ncbi:MAG: protein-L-isoaspartate(D-aspartate) O-methyltransferase [Acidobacteriota bacterium]|nr:protein-L-isoaspartate(D-aspartate) O-methyltransferase [Acidobacteriota bacterium]MDH3529960.1 protein-L-isoaspartate(D-aspartate) O-methyltransferase [Acidobacteriota bacterium]
MDEYKIAREKMVARLRDHYKISDPRVLEVMATVPRHLFVPEALKFQAYRDNALPISSNQTISQPYIVAKMTELLELTPSSKVLEIGAGSGYQSIILARLARAVYAIERLPVLAEVAKARMSEFAIKNVTIQQGDGSNGWEIYAPYDAILVAAGSPTVPKPLLEQLKTGGRLVIPIGDDPKTQVLFRIVKEENGYRSEDHGNCSFVPLIGEHGWKNS